MRCTFCATGKGGFARNLAPHEIVDQVLALEEYFGQRVSNVVFMGMGEPLLNVPNVLKAHEALNKEIGIGARHITISTVGVRGSIEKLAHAQLQSVLAVSLHAPNQELRETIIPSAKVYPMEDLLQDCEQYFVATGRRVTFEYTLLGGINDQPEHAKELGRLLYARNLASHVNLIPYNPVDDSDYQRPSRATVYAFRDILEGSTSQLRFAKPEVSRRRRRADSCVTRSKRTPSSATWRRRRRDASIFAVNYTTIVNDTVK